MKKATCTTFETVLKTIQQKGITTRAALMADPQLYARFWAAAEDYSYYCLASKNGKVTADGKQLSGNNAKVGMLESLGITTREDIAMDCVVRMVEYVEKLIQKPTVAYMKNYAYSIVNSVVNTICRSLPPEDITVVPWNGTIGGSEDPCTYEDMIADDTYDPERIHFERETVKELEVKQLREQDEERQAILRDVALLSKRPPEVLVYLCSKLGMKPAAIAAFILENGTVTSFAKALMGVSDRFGIPLSELQARMRGGMASEKDLKLDTNDDNKVVDQVYHLRSRAKKRIDKISK